MSPVSIRPARTTSIPTNDNCAFCHGIVAGGPLGSVSVIVLVVDDYETFRRFVRSMLGERPGFHIGGEVSDGLEAVQKAEELRPDLILLDIGMPTLNGIEAARRIRKVSPESKILFVSQESSADMVQEAFRFGALGYVAKTDAGSELLPAVKAVLRGETFAGSGLAERKLTAALSSSPVKESLS